MVAVLLDREGNGRSGITLVMHLRPPIYPLMGLVVGGRRWAPPPTLLYGA